MGRYLSSIWAEAAGVNYTITAFTDTGPVFEQTAPARGSVAS
jgi:hypothetical protein